MSVTGGMRRARLAAALLMIVGVAAAAPGGASATPVRPSAYAAPAAGGSAERAAVEGSAVERATAQQRAKKGKPGKPRQVTATAGHERLTVRWKKPTTGGGPVLGYRVQLRQSDGTWTTVATTKRKARSRVLTGLDNGSSYRVRVAARTAQGFGKSGTARVVLPTTLDVSILSSHGCAVLPNGTVECWGLNGSGQLGTGNTNDSITPVQVVGLTDAVAVGVGTAHTCAVRGDGTVWCFGGNGTGALGVAPSTSSLVPVQAEGVAGAVDVVAGDGHTCALLETGAVWCWGFGADGQLGRGAFASDSTPAPVLTIAGAQQIAAGTRHTCAIHSRGRVSCWGSNVSGSLGLGGIFDFPRNAPNQVPGVTGAVFLSASENTTCVVQASGAAQCWGSNLGGALGNGETGTSENTATDVLGLTDAASVAVGRFHTCALRTNGAVSCWGSNVFGQAGTGDNSETLLPTATVGVGAAVQVEAGGANTCARTRAGTLLCWGDTAFVGTVVDPTTQSGVPVRPAGL